MSFEYFHSDILDSNVTIFKFVSLNILYINKVSPLILSVTILLTYSQDMVCNHKYDITNMLVKNL